jgi:hypothetical protein
MANPTRRVGRLDRALAYAWSRYRTNIAERMAAAGCSVMNVAEDYNRPHRLEHFSASASTARTSLRLLRAELPRAALR